MGEGDLCHDDVIFTPDYLKHIIDDEAIGLIIITMFMSNEHPFSRTHATQGDEEAHGILEGISSLHSWIKTQTMIRWVFVILFFFLYLLVFLFSFQITQYSTRPTKLGKKKDDMSFDDVSIQKLERLTFFLRTTTMTL